MTWLMWQQQRRQVLVIGATVLAATVFLVVTGLHLQYTYHEALRSCSGTRQGCANLGNTVFVGDNRMFDIVVASGFILPYVLGLFWGVPLLTREFEEGTHRLAWSQTVTRLRWLGVRLGWTLLAAGALTAAVSVLITWWYAPVNAVELDRLGSAVFDSQGVVTIGYALFGVALGVAAAALMRRTVAAMGVTFLVFGIVRYTVAQYLRPILLPAKVLLTSLTTVGSSSLTGSWVLSQTIENAAGRPVPLLHGVVNPSDVPSACRVALYGRPLANCLDARGFHIAVRYQPASRFWALQGIETALFVAAGTALVVFAFWLVSRRDA